MEIENLKKTKNLNLRIDEVLNDELLEASEKFGKTRSDIVRLILNGELDDYKKYSGLSKDDIRDFKLTIQGFEGDLAKIEKEINRIGINFNQLVKHRTCSDEILKSFKGELKNLSYLLLEISNALYKL